MAILVLYATREGQTEKIATVIAQQLRDRGNQVDLVNAATLNASQDLDPSGYEAFVLGASMHAGGLEKELLQWLTRNGKKIDAQPTFLFVVTLSAATKDPTLRRTALADVHKKVSQQVDAEQFHLEIMAGALTYSKYRAPVKWLMRRIAKQAGGDTDTHKDYEYTDWQQVKDFTDKIVVSLGQRSG